MKPKLLSRTLQLRTIEFAKPCDKNLSELLCELNNCCSSSVGHRVVSDEAIGGEGKQVILSYFYDRFESYQNGAVYFEVWSYVPGQMPAGFTPDFSAPNASYDVSKVVGLDGNEREMIYISHVLVYGNCAIIEATNGTGGVHLIERYINKVLRNKLPARTPHVAFNTAVSSDLNKEIEAGGGVVSVALGISSAHPSDGNKVVGLLSGARSVFSKTSMVTLNWSANANETLDTDEVVQEALMAKSDDLEKIHIKLKRGSINGVAKYKITEPIEVRDIGGKNPNHDDIRKSMLSYFERLLKPGLDGVSIIDGQGNLVV